MPTFSLTVKVPEGTPPPLLTVHADTQEKAMRAYKIKYPEAEILACEWVTEND